MVVKAKVRSPQVFINFRGAELRDNFVNHLVKALRDGEINVFIDAHELKGRKLGNLFTRIRKSKMALAVFSKRYCESKWCLDELVEMNERMNARELVVIPIFYNVTASDVERAANLDKEADFDGEEEEFTILFKKMKQKYADDTALVRKWELALQSIIERTGLSSELYKDDLVKAIVVEVRRCLGMPREKTMSDEDVAFAALCVISVFSFIIAPLFLPDVKFFKTGKWVLGFQLLVLACHIWAKENQNTALASIRQPRHSRIWGRENHNKPPATIRQPRHSSICDRENHNQPPSFIRLPRHSSICDRENQNKPPAFIRQPRHSSICVRVNQNNPPDCIIQ